MAKEELIRLFRNVKTDPQLKQKLNSAPNPEAFVKMARDIGYDFTLEEWQAVTGFQVEEFEAELSEIPGL